MTFHSVSSFKLVAYPSGSYNSIPDAVITNALNVAESEILAACRPFHTLPLATGSYGQSSELAMLYDAQVTIASYRLQTYTGFKPNADEQGDSVLRNQYLEVKGEGGLLDKISQGKLILPMESDATPTVQEKRPRVYGNTGRTIRNTDDSGKEYV